MLKALLELGYSVRVCWKAIVNAMAMESQNTTGQPEKVGHVENWDFNVSLRPMAPAGYAVQTGEYNNQVREVLAKQSNAWM